MDRHFTQQKNHASRWRYGSDLVESNLLFGPRNNWLQESPYINPRNGTTMNLVSVGTGHWFPRSVQRGVMHGSIMYRNNKQKHNHGSVHTTTTATTTPSPLHHYYSYISPHQYHTLHFSWLLLPSTRCLPRCSTFPWRIGPSVPVTRRSVLFFVA